MKQALFRVEAGPRIGLGHLRRSLSLATALCRQGVQSVFLVSGQMGGLTMGWRPGICLQRLEGMPAWTAEDFKATLQVATSSKAQMVVVDSPKAPVRYLADLMKAGLFVVVRDDGGLSRLPAHLVLNGNADAKRLRYLPFNGTKTDFLLGPEYAVLPKEFWRPAPRVVNEKVQEILVTLGGEDARDLMPRLIRLLDELPGDFGVTAIIGPFFKNRDEIKWVASRAGRRVRQVEGADSLYPWMRQADLAISGAGQTLYELACVGCPTLAIQVADDQAGQLAALAKAGCLRMAALGREPNLLKEVGQAAVSFLHDPSGRQALASAGQRLIDGQGSLRVARAVFKREGKNHERFSRIKQSYRSGV